MQVLLKVGDADFDLVCGSPRFPKPSELSAGQFFALARSQPPFDEYLRDDWSKGWRVLFMGLSQDEGNSDAAPRHPISGGDTLIAVATKYAGTKAVKEIEAVKQICVLIAPKTASATSSASAAASAPAPGPVAIATGSACASSGGGAGGGVGAGAGSGVSSRALTPTDLEVVAVAASREALRSIGVSSFALSPPTASLLGDAVLEELSIGSRDEVLPDDARGSAVLSHEQQLVVAAKKSEDAVIKCLTPFLMDICDAIPSPAGDGAPLRRVLVNSEYLQWLRHPASAREKLELKPDFFLSWHPFVEYRNASPTQSPAGDGFLFGLVPSDALTKAMCAVGVFEGKLGPLTHKDFGELCTYHQCIDGPCWGMLFDATSFWLYTSVRGTPARLLRGKWTQPGSKEAIRAHFAAVPEPNLLKLLRALTADLRVEVCQPLGTKRCYLGSGAHGHVFAVGDPARPQALKVILGPADVATEFGLIAAAADKCGDVVVRPVPGSLWEYDNLGPASGGGYLLEQVGEAFKVKEEKDCTAVFLALSKLHIGRVSHGDARLPNLLAVRDAKGVRQLKWVDLRQSALLPESASRELRFRKDLRTLAASILECATSNLPAGVSAAIDRYSVGSAVDEVSAAVWAAKKK